MAEGAGGRAAALAPLAELFREHGFEGASLSLISKRTGLGKGSLYHFFPGGKEEMAAAVLVQIEGWFEENLFAPLRTDDDPRRAIRAMFRAVDQYFHSGGRICLVGAFALGEARDRFAGRILHYFTLWRNALADALHRAGKNRAVADELAEDVVAGIQGALTAARAMDDTALFGRLLRRMEARLELG
jgi:TetR/AcrR family transcriptional regulator, lmrAB and yxaGH operons repressor